MKYCYDKEGSIASCDNMDGHYAKWNKLEKN